MTFEEWLDEIEVFSTRRERLLESFENNPSYSTIEAWLYAAYMVGHDEARRLAS